MNQHDHNHLLRRWSLGQVLAICLAAAVISTPAHAESPALTDTTAVAELQSLIAESRYDDTFALGDSLLTELRQAGADDSPAEADILEQLVQAGYRSGRNMDPLILEMAERAVAIKTKVFGLNHPATSASLMHLANLLNERRECERALPVYDQAIANLVADAVGHEQAIAVLTSSRGVALRRLGRYEEALGSYERALAMQEIAYGGDHPDLASTLNNLANVLVQLGDYSRARRAHERALAIRMQFLGPDHEWVGETYNNLSTVLGYMGEYVASLRAEEQAVNIFKAKLGPDHERTLLAGLNLGIVYLDMGDSNGAIPIFEMVLAGLETLYGPEHDQITYALDPLAAAHRGVGDPAGALEIYRRSLRIIETSWGVDNPESAATLLEMGRCLIELERLDEAADILARSLAISEQIGDPDSPELCSVLQRTGELRLRLGDPPGALAFAERSGEIVVSRLGESHPLLAEALVLRARALRRLGRDDDALHDALRAEAISLDHLHTTMRVLSESHALDYARSRTVGLDLALSMLEPGERGEHTVEVWQALIHSRAAVLDEVTTRRRRLTDSETAATDSLLSRSLELRERLSNLVLRGPGWEDVASYRHLITDARAEIEADERRLALSDAGSRTSVTPAPIAFSDVRDRLDPGSALVAYVRYEQESTTEFGDGTASYKAFVLAGPTAQPVCLDLGPADLIDALVTDWQDQIRHGSGERESGSDRGMLRLANDPAANLMSYRTAGTALRKTIWDPVAPLLDHGERVFLVLDGSLHLVNMISLPFGDDRYLVDENLLFHVLDTERSLADDRLHRSGSGLLVVGDADYGPADRTVADARRSVLDGLTFAPLPHVNTEIETVCRLWRDLAAATGASVDVLTGDRATESAFKANLLDHGVLHLATHGFFVPGGIDRADAASPLVFSGLALTGANGWRQATSGADDGLLTAEEVSALDLSQVDWAVLSACETGLGALKDRGEGVFGLRRAFTLAGARTVIMSLWNVDDRAADAWMTALYRSRLRDRTDTAHAVRAASRAVLAERRAARQSTHPASWAGFIAAGDWR